MNMRFSTNIVFSVVLIFCVAIACLKGTSVIFTSRRNEYLNGYSTKCGTLSRMQCCSECVTNNNCLATNYNRQSSECELLAQHPNFIIRDVVTRQNWTLYTKEDGCGGDWVPFYQSCYLAFDAGVSWSNARTQCVANSADLVDILSLEENAFVFNYSNSNDIFPVWVGLTDNTPTNRFIWSTGEDVEFTAYIPGEPHGGGNKCVCNSVGIDEWDDRPCHYTYSFICEKPIA